MLIATEAMGMLKRELNCALCGSAFTCKRWFGCWCQSVPVSKERLRALKALTTDCICPACLQSQNWPALKDSSE